MIRRLASLGETLRQDVIYGLRLIRKSPGFSFVAVASLAFGIGASTVMFSFANTMVFRPVHADKPEELIEVFTSDFDGPPHYYGGSSYPDYLDFSRLPIFDSLLATSRATATLSGNGRSELLQGLLVSGNYFDTLGLKPARGRFFAADENAVPARDPVVVISHDAWTRRFADDPGIVGKVIELNSHAFTVVGVAPPKFGGTSIEHTAEFFVPAMMQTVIVPGEKLLDARRARTFRLLGRLAPGVSLAEADAALDNAAQDLFRLDPVAWRDRSGGARVITAVYERDARFADAGPGTLVFIFGGLSAGVFALLAIACVNVATVLLARATARRKEIAVRLAMGASRKRVIRQLLTECALLAVAGGAIGLVITQAAAALYLRLRPSEAPAFDLTIDYRILIFAMAISAITVVLFGLAPALQTTRPDINAELKDGVRAFRVRGWRFNLRSALVVTQIAVSLALLAGAALMFRSALAGQLHDPGFRREGVVSVGIDLSALEEAGGARGRFLDEAVRAAASMPGVERAALARLVPLEGSNSQREIEIKNGGAPERLAPDINVVGAGYFALLDIPLKQGREFADADRLSAPPVALVNESMARAHWNGAPLGKTFVDSDDGRIFTIVGVVGDLRHRSFGEAPRPMVYFSAAQNPLERATLHLRTAVPPRELAPALQRSLSELNRSAALTRAESMDEYFDRVTMPQQLGAAGAIGTATLELALVIMALYGVIAFSAAQRRREIGLRLALGASNRSVLTLVMREGLLLTAIGIVIGLVLAFVGGAALQSELIGVGAADPVSFGAAALILVLVGSAASYLPARRAILIEPSSALKGE